MSLTINQRIAMGLFRDFPNTTILKLAGMYANIFTGAGNQADLEEAFIKMANNFELLDKYIECNNENNINKKKCQLTSNGISAMAILVVPGPTALGLPPDTPGIIPKPDWSTFPDYLSEILTTHHEDKRTSSEWPDLALLIVLIKNGTRYESVDLQALETKIRELSGKQTVKILEPIEDDGLVVLKKLVEIEVFPLPRSILWDMRVVLKAASPLRVSELYEALKQRIAPEVSDEDDPKLRRALLNRIAKHIDGVRFEYVFDPLTPDVTRVRMTNTELAKFEESGFAFKPPG